MRRAILVAVLLAFYGSAAFAAQPPGPADGAALPGVQTPGPGPAPAGALVLVRTAIGFILLTAGLGSLVIAAAYWRPSGPTLAAFGAFSLVYGGVILIALPAIGGQLAIPRDTRLFVSAAMSYMLPVPALVYMERIHGAGWLSLIRRLWQVGAVVTLAAILFDLATGTPRASWPLYRLFLIVTWGVLLPHAIFWRQPDPVEGIVRRVATVTFGLTILHDIALAVGWMPWSVSLGVFGVGIFVGGLGFVAVRGAFADQRELAAVEHEMATARSIQNSILPHQLPDVCGLDLAARYVPVRSVAGDLYDFVRIDDARLGVLVADVAGHGLSAALIASMAKVAFSAQHALATEPDRILAEINHVLCGYFDARYVTAAYLLIDTSANTIRYSLAGHPPPLLWRARDRRIVELREAGLVLGLFDHASYRSEVVPFEAGDRVVLYTDGLTEATHRTGAYYGDKAFADFMASHTAGSADRFVDALLADVRAWTDGSSAPRPFVDDLTVVVVSRT